MWLELDGKGALHQQVYRSLRLAILAGELAPGARLPSSRALAREAGLSRNTILLALEQLVSEGYARGRRGSGTYVPQELPPELAPPARKAPGAAPAPPARPPRLSRAARRAAAQGGREPASWDLPRHEVAVDFRYGEPAYHDLPLDTWARLLARRVRRASARDLAYRAPGGHPALRAALAAHLARTRGVRCAPEQVIVTHGSQQAIDIAARVLVDPGDGVALEDPHYPGLRLAFAAAGARLCGIPLDAHGLRVERLARRRGVRLACVTPSHQYPTGAVLPASRRLALLDWARRNDAFVLEDDYDSEFRYAGRPLESLQALDGGSRVLYVGTLSKLLFPALRIGYLVPPEPLLDACLRALAAADTGAARLEQAALAEFIEAGHLERHLRRARARNASRRDALLRALDSHLGDRVQVDDVPAGLHVWMRVPGCPAEQAATLRRAGLREGVAIYPSDPCHFAPPPCASFILGHGGLEEGRIEEGVRRIASAFARAGVPARAEPPSGPSHPRR
jgi:GntR family transcriptional regulator/MocR family aminotransferase